MSDFVMYVLIAVLCCAFTRCVCELEPFVVGGDYAKISAYPHSVYMTMQCHFRWICGAAILNQRILITAAHCLSGCDMYYKEQIIIAHAGHENLEKVKTTRSVLHITIHADYDENTVVNDIGLMVVKKDFPLGSNIKRVIIARRFPQNIKTAVVAGWGTINEDGETTILLKSVSQEIRSKEVCAQIGTLGRGMFCAGSTSILADRPSKGDSGGALITPALQQIGLVSFRVRTLPALVVYTNISYYYDWIDRYANIMYCKSYGN